MFLSPAQLEVDSLVSSFLDRATEWRSLAAVTAGGMASHLSRLGAMSMGTGAASRLLSVGVGLGTESSVFEATHRLLAEGGNIPNLWRWNGPGGLRQGLLTSLVTFGSLKGAGRLAQGENVVLRHLLQDAAMVLGHNVSGAFRITPRPTGSFTEQFLHAEATNLQLSAGMAFVHTLSSRGTSLEQGVDFLFRVRRHSEGDMERPMAFVYGRQPLVVGGTQGEKAPVLTPSLWAMSENKGEKGGPPTTEPNIDDGWDEDKQTPTQWDEKTPPWTDQEASWFQKATSPSSSPQSIRAAERTHQVLRAFLLAPKEDMKAVEEGIEDYLTYCRTQGKEGKNELYTGIMEVRERARIFQTPKEKYQYLYMYTRLAENLDPRDLQFWGELGFLGKNLTDPHFPPGLMDVMAGTFVKLSETLWRERPAVAHELKDTFEVLRFIYLHEKLSSDLRGRAMTIYVEFRSLIEEE
jgi:hypothetical protein